MKSTQKMQQQCNVQVKFKINNIYVLLYRVIVMRRSWHIYLLNKQTLQHKAMENNSGNWP